MSLEDPTKNSVNVKENNSSAAGGERKKTR